MIRIYALRIDDLQDSNLFQNLLGKVSADKRDKIGKFIQKEDADRALLGDLLIRYILISREGVSNNDISFEYNEFGKPSYKHLTDFHFNISHSGKWIVCATDDMPIGIDVERIATIDMELAEHYFSKQECETLFSLSPPEQRLFFYELWTCKESYLKLNGSGLSIPLDSFSVISDSKSNASIESGSGQRESVYLKKFEIDKEYKMAVCASKNSFGDINLISFNEIATCFL